ncbi:hypothetical protein Esti_005155 [Eimeria stiedai]
MRVQLLAASLYASIGGLPLHRPSTGRQQEDAISELVLLKIQYSRDSTRPTSFLALNKAKKGPLAQKSFNTFWGNAQEDYVAKLRAFNALKRWLAENGALLDVHGLTLEPRSHTGQCTLVSHGEATETRGLTAARAYRQGELLASIPTGLRFDLRLLEQFVNGVTGGRAVREYEASRHHDREEELTPVIKPDQSICLAFPLALFQLRQSENLDSRLPSAWTRTTCRGIPLAHVYEGWLLYMRLLTPPPETIPLFWRASERSLPHFELRVRENLSLQGSQSPEVDAKALFKRLLSAYAITLSRSVKMPSEGKAFVPLVDLCDHAAEGGNARLRLSKSSIKAAVNNVVEDPLNTCNSDDQRCCHDREFIQLVATKDISPGDAICVSYGDFDTPTLLLNYGLLPLVNPHDKIDVEFSPRRVHFALRAIGVERLMVADDFSFLGPRVLRRLARLGLTAFGNKRERANESACVKHEPVITVRGDAKPDERLIAAAKVSRRGHFMNATIFLAQSPVCLCTCVQLLGTQKKAARFVTSFLQHALFEHYSTTAFEDAMMPSLACGLFVNDQALAYNVRHSLNPTTSPLLHVLQPTPQGSSHRFMQAKSKLNLMVFITNIFFPHQEPPEYKRKFQRGGCPRWLLDPRKGTPDLTKDWLPADGWSYDLANQVIEYRGSEEAKEPAHAFPFNLFLPRRASTRFALIKRDFFCQGTQIQSTIMLNGAKEAGLIFRGVGERNFWAVMLTLGGGINLLRVKNGEKQNLGGIGDFLVQGGQWYTLNVQELIGDVRVTVGEVKVKTHNSAELIVTMLLVLEGKEPVKFSRQQEKEEEVRPKNYEDCALRGLLAVCSSYEVISAYFQLRELRAS